LLSECILRNIDNLSKTLQNPAAKAQDIVQLITSTLQSIRTTEMFNQFWNEVMQYATSDEINVCSPKLPQKLRAPRSFEALDLALEAIRDKFD